MGNATNTTIFTINITTPDLASYYRFSYGPTIDTTSLSIINNLPPQTNVKFVVPLDILNKNIKEQNIRFKIKCKGPRQSHKMLHWELKYLMTHKPVIGNVESWQKWITSKVITIVSQEKKKKVTQGRIHQNFQMFLKIHVK